MKRIKPDQVLIFLQLKKIIYKEKSSDERKNLFLERQNLMQLKLHTVKPVCNGHPWYLKKVAV
jgi:hypothetical protein